MSHLLGITDIIFNLIGNVLYPLFAVFFQIIDAVQAIFYAFAGLQSLDVNNVRVTGEGGPDTLNSPNSADTRNGIVYYMLRHETIQNIFFSMVILAVFLLVIFTVMAFIKNMYQTKQKKWQDIISSTIKGAISFVFIPVCCLLGVIAGNFLLQALNEATTTSKDTTISRQLFMASAYSANIFRKDGWNYNDDIKDVEDLKKDYKIYTETTGDRIVAKIEDNKDGEYYAQIVDTMYKNGNYKNIWYVGNVTGYYNLWKVNYLLLGAGGIFMLFALIKISFGMVKRLFMLVLLFVISPVVCSLYPLDDGAAVGSWRKSFTGNFFSAYGAVVGMNLFFCLVPIFNNIDVVWGAGGGGLDWIDIVPLMITICALYMVTDFIKLAQGFIPGGGEDALSAGTGLAGNVKKRLQQGAAKVGNRGKKVIGAFSRGLGAASERRKELKEAKEKTGYNFNQKRTDFGSDEDWQNYKKERDSKLKGIKSDLGGGGARAFGGSMLSSMGHGALNLVEDTADAFGSAMGFGKASNLRQSWRENREQGVDRAKRQKAQRDLMRDLTPTEDDHGNITGSVDLSKVGKAFTGKYGEQLYNSVKDTDEFKKLLEHYGISEKPTSASDAGALFANLGKQQKAQDKLEAIQVNQQDWKEAIDKIARDARSKGVGLTESDILESVLEKQEFTIDPGDSDAEQAIYRAINDLISNGIKLKDKDGNVVKDKDGREKTISYDEAFSQGQLNIAAQNAYETAQSVRANLKDDNPVAQQMDNYLANLKEMLTKMDNGEEVKEVNMNIDSLKNAEETMIKQLNKDLSDTVKSAGKDIQKAITKVEDATKKDKS